MDTNLAILLEALRAYDVYSLIDILNIDTDDLVDAFVDYISDNYDKVLESIEWN